LTYKVYIHTAFDWTEPNESCLTDQSIEVNDGNFSEQMRIGTLRQVLQVARSSDGPILNALSFPRPLAGVKPSPISSEVEAWRATEGMKFCKPAAHFPVGEMRWGLAATAGGRHYLHVDNDGLGTVIDVKTGAKLWIICTPNDGQDKRAFASITQFLEDFDVTKIDKRWKAEAIYLTSGTRL